LEGAIAALWSSISTNAIGDTATVVSDAEIRQALNAIESANLSLGECAFFFHPYVYWNQLHAIVKYYNQYTSTGGVGASTVQTGNFGVGGYSKSYKGVLYGVPVYLSTNIVSGLQTYRNMLLHKSAFGFAVQTKGGSRVRVQAENAIRNLGMLTVIDIVYGVAVLREPAAVLINSSNAFIGS
jgi:hypothetical protein